MNTWNMNVKFFLLWWELSSGPPDLQSSSNLLFLKPLLLLLWLFGKTGWPKFLQLSPLAGRGQCGCQFTYKLVYGEVWLHPVFQFPLSHHMGLQHLLRGLSTISTKTSCLTKNNVLWLKLTLLLKIECWETHIYMIT